MIERQKLLRKWLFPEQLGHKDEGKTRVAGTNAAQQKYNVSHSSIYKILVATLQGKNKSVKLIFIIYFIY